MVRAGRAAAYAAAGIFAVLGLCLFWRSAVAASTQEDAPLSMSNMLVCDTAEEVHAFVGGDRPEQVDSALARVNALYGPHACSVATALFRTSGEEGTMAIQDGVVKIAKIQVFAVVVDGALQTLTVPQIQFAPIFEKATSV
jgi:hypothetical protein